MFRLRRNVGMLLVRRVYRFDGPLCREHAESEGWSWLGKTLAQGWWGSISFFTNWFAIAADVKTIRGASKLSAPSSVRASTLASPAPSGGGIALDGGWTGTGVLPGVGSTMATGTPSQAGSLPTPPPPLIATAPGAMRTGWQPDPRRPLAEPTRSPAMRKPFKVALIVVAGLIGLAVVAAMSGLLDKGTIESSATLSTGTHGDYTISITNHMSDSVTVSCTVEGKDESGTSVARDQVTTQPLAPEQGVQVSSHLHLLPGYTRSKIFKALTSACGPLAT